VPQQTHNEALHSVLLF